MLTLLKSRHGGVGKTVKLQMDALTLALCEVGTRGAKIAEEHNMLYRRGKTWDDLRAEQTRHGSFRCRTVHRDRPHRSRHEPVHRGAGPPLPPASTTRSSPCPPGHPRATTAAPPVGRAAARRRRLVRRERSCPRTAPQWVRAYWLENRKVLIQSPGYAWAELVAATALVHLGASVDEAIVSLRRARPQALADPDFLALLRAQ
jgi:hypothetical protein